MPIVEAAMIGAAANLAGGLIGANSHREARELQAAANERNIALQREFAQNGIQWRVQDAEKAGVHPLFALGANTHSFSPVSVGIGPDMSMANAVSGMGQDISRAMHASSSQGQRDKAYTAAVQGLTLQRAELENELLRSRIAQINASRNPPMPSVNSVGSRMLIPGQTGSSEGQVTIEPVTRLSTDPGAPHREAAAVADLGHSRTAGGGYSAIPSRDVKERIEDNWVQQLMWSFRNNVLPSVGVNQSPPNVPVPAGYDAWIYDPRYQEYRPMRRPRFLPESVGRFFHY